MTLRAVVSECACPFCGAVAMVDPAGGRCEDEDCPAAGLRAVSCSGGCSRMVCRRAMCPAGWRLAPGLDALAVHAAETYRSSTPLTFEGPDGATFAAAGCTCFGDALARLWAHAGDAARRQRRRAPTPPVDDLSDPEGEAS